MTDSKIISNASLAAEERDGAGNVYRYAVDQEGRAHVLDCTAAAEMLETPAQLGGCAVVELGAESFASSPGLRAQQGFDAPSRLEANVALFAAGRGRGAAARNVQVREVVVPEGVAFIGRAAFRGCTGLTRIELPDTLRGIDDFAFARTSLASLRIPRSCTRLGEHALRTGPETVEGVTSFYHSSVRSVEVDPGNEAFAVAGGLLCRHLEGGGLEAIFCPGEIEDLILPDEVVRIAPQAFAGTARIGNASVSAGVAFDPSCGLLANSACGRLTVRPAKIGAAAREPALVLPLPSGSAGLRVLAATRGRASLDASALAQAFDEVVLDLKDPLEQARLMLARLADPAYLADDVRSRYERHLQSQFDNLVANFGARGSWDGFDLMVDAGVLNAGNASRAVEVLTALGDASSCARVLELKRTRMQTGGWGYDL